ncbi:MAG TPA: hypothetical protein VFT72_13590 [Opitutaceae bacterium]|nr:hypothetical protein [Opitutaceae bacterium]
MNAKILLRTVVFLLLLFVILYIGMSNPQKIDFYFPMLLERRITQPAAVLYFAMFAIGVIAGMMLHSGGGGGKRSDSGSKKK